jgi:heme/copper-type cytochrome/quinol oxidase subunit 2
MKKLSTIVLAVALFALPLVGLAATVNPVTAPAGGPAASTANSVGDLIVFIINIALGIVGLIAVLFLIIGGFRYVTSAGNEEAAGQAKKMITNAIIGIVIIILAFVIVRVVVNALATGSAA